MSKNFSELLYFQTPKKMVNVKLFYCGDYIQLYIFELPYFINDRNLEKIEDNLILEKNYIADYKKINKKDNLKEIEIKNINRSKNSLSRLVLSNYDKFKTFITLTFDDDIFDVAIANEEFHKFITKLKRVFGELLYIAVPEFQKNGRVHYHILTNIDYYTSQLLVENVETTRLYHNKTKSQIQKIQYEYLEDNLIKKYNKNELNLLPVVFRNINNQLINCKCTYNKKSSTYKYFKTIKYWNNGYTSVIPIENINVVGYMSKYMTKDIDNRLFSKKRYLFSANIKTPCQTYLNLNNKSDLSKYNKILNNFDIIYQNHYLDKFDNKIKFIELKNKER